MTDEELPDNRRGLLIALVFLVVIVLWALGSVVRCVTPMPCRIA
jgi:hypothetical protein